MPPRPDQRAPSTEACACAHARVQESGSNNKNIKIKKGAGVESADVERQPGAPFFSLRIFSFCIFFAFRNGGVTRGDVSAQEDFGLKKKSVLLLKKTVRFTSAFVVRVLC